MAGFNQSSKTAAQDTGSQDFERLEVQGEAFGKNHPTTVVGGTLKQNGLRDFNPPNGSTYVGLYVDEPHVASDEEITEGSHIAYKEDSSTNYKVVNADDPDTRVYEDEGEVVFDGNVFEFDRIAPADEFEFEDDSVIFKFSGGSSRNVSRTFDQNGAQSGGVQRDASGEILLSDNGYPMQNQGLYEYSDEEDGPLPHMIRATIARDDLVGNKVAVLLRRLSDVDEDYDGDSYWTTIYGEATDEVVEHTEAAFENRKREPGRVEFDGVELIELAPRFGEIPISAIIETGWLEWSYQDAVDELEAQGIEAGSSAAQQQAAGQGSETTPTDTNDSGLTDSEVGVVNQIESALPNDGVDADDIETTVSNNQGLFSEEDDQESVTNELKSRLTA